MTHSPGPWTAVGSHPQTIADSTIIFHTLEPPERILIKREYRNSHGLGSTQFIGEVYIAGGPEPEMWANAHLIAAAPDLLAALIDIATRGIHGEGELPVTPSELREIARAAIGKATKTLQTG